MEDSLNAFLHDMKPMLPHTRTYVVATISNGVITQRIEYEAI
jgi:hypothetical protein